MNLVIFSDFYKFIVTKALNLVLHLLNRVFHYIQVFTYLENFGGRMYLQLYCPIDTGSEFNNVFLFS